MPNIISDIIPNEIYNEVKEFIKDIGMDGDEDACDHTWYILKDLDSEAFKTLKDSLLKDKTIKERFDELSEDDYYTTERALGIALAERVNELME